VQYSEPLAVRVRAALGQRSSLHEKKMFGGLAFMLRGHMCCGIIGDTLMVRVGSAAHEQALARPYARPMDFTGKPTRGFVYVDPEGIAAPAGLQGWLDLALAYNGSLPEK
jgi:TfoX/Sxy family transcriptional regulator of competence genes